MSELWKLAPNDLWMRIEILSDIFQSLADLGDASMQMNADRGGVFIQVSNRDWPDGIDLIVNASKYKDYLEVEVGRYSSIIHCAGDVIA